jgi:hypothetical protein
MDCGLPTPALRPNTKTAVRQFSLWQSAWKTPQSANTALWIWAWSLAIERNPAPAIFHRETACLTHHRFLTRNFSSVKLIRVAISRPKLYVNGLSWHNISWYYTFKWIFCAFQWKQICRNLLFTWIHWHILKMFLCSIFLNISSPFWSFTQLCRYSEVRAAYVD